MNRGMDDPGMRSKPLPGRLSPRLRAGRAALRDLQGWRFLGSLLILPFLLASLISQATMLTAGPDDRLTMILCTQDGLVQMVMDADGQPVEPAGDHSGHMGCEWAANAKPALGGPALAAPVIAGGVQPLRYAQFAALPERSMALPARLARGPPPTL